MLGEAELLAECGVEVGLPVESQLVAAAGSVVFKQRLANR